MGLVVLVAVNVRAVSGFGVGHPELLGYLMWGLVPLVDALAVTGAMLVWGLGKRGSTRLSLLGFVLTGQMMILVHAIICLRFGQQVLDALALFEMGIDKPFEWTMRTMGVKALGNEYIQLVSLVMLGLFFAPFHFGPGLFVAWRLRGRRLVVSKVTEDA
jgi:hypothetical protein